MLRKEDAIFEDLKKQKKKHVKIEETDLMTLKTYQDCIHVGDLVNKEVPGHLRIYKQKLQN